MSDRIKYLLWWLILVAIALLVSIPAQAQWTETGMNDAVGSVADSSPTVQIHNAGCANGMLYTPLCGRLYSAILSDSVQVTVRIDSVAGDGQLFSQSGFLLAVEDTSDATSSVYGVEYLSRGDLRVIDSDESQPVDSVLVGGALVPRIVDLIRLDGASDDTLRWTVTNVAGDTLYQWDDVKTLVDSIYVSLGAASREAGTDSTWIYARNLTYTEGAAPPLAPASVSATSPDYIDEVACTWPFVGGAASYTARLYDDGDVLIDTELVVDSGDPEDQSHTFSALTWGDTYYCHVTTTGGAGTQSSNFTLKQAAPSIVSVVSASSTSLDVTWTNPFGANIDSNKVYVDTVLETTIAVGTSYTVTGLTTDVEVDITVSAKNAGGNSDQSSIVAGTPTSAPVASNVVLTDIDAETAPGSVAFQADLTSGSGTTYMEMGHTGTLDTYRITDKETIGAGGTITYTPNAQFDPNVMDSPAWWFMLVWESGGAGQVLGSYTGGSTQEGVYVHPRSVTRDSYMLDEVTTQPIAAYSLNKLDADYTGDAVRVRDSADDSEHDIGFDANGLFAGFSGVIDGDTAYVITLYDQVGSDDLTNATARNQLWINNPSGSKFQLSARTEASRASGLKKNGGSAVWAAINGNDDIQVYALAAIPDDATGNQQYLTQIGKYGPDNTDGFFKLERQGTTNNWEVAVQISTSTRINADTPADSHVEGTWIVIHAAKDQTPGGFFRSFEDNVQQASTATSAAIKDNTGGDATLTVMNADSMSDTARFYDGSAHTFLFFDAYLTSGDNAIIYGYLNTWKSTLE